jgi:hypothetical protein
MIILSIDVGIKNLAYCCFKIENNNYNIIDWDVIDLTKTLIYKCNKCNKNACLYINNLYYCKMCQKKNKLTIFDNKNINLKKIKLNDLLRFINENNINIGIENNKFKLLQITKDYIDNNMLQIIKKEKSNIDFIEIGKNLKDIFDDKFSSIDINIVLIENQIGPLAVKMKTLQGMIAQYFIMNKINNIQFISSINKLKEFSNNEKISYKERKVKSVEICEDYIDEKNKFFFKSHKKKDDLADSLLQGIYYIKNNNLIQI